MKMNRLVPYLVAAGVVQWVIAAANIFIPGKLRYGENIARLTPIVREVFIVHAVYIVGVLVGFGALSVWFAPELASGAGLGRFLSVFLAVFWVPRVFVQLFYYDRDVKRANPAGHVLFTTLFVYLAVVYTLAALGVVR